MEMVPTTKVESGQEASIAIHHFRCDISHRNTQYERGKNEKNKPPNFRKNSKKYKLCLSFPTFFEIKKKSQSGHLLPMTQP
jgi:hypothetical protein